MPRIPEFTSIPAPPMPGCREPNPFVTEGAAIGYAAERLRKCIDDVHARDALRSVRYFLEIAEARLLDGANKDQ